jgi:pilus assembly protein Flp/PilA
MEFFKRLARDREGGTAIEYAVLAVLAGVSLIATFNQLGGSVNNAFTLADNSFASNR